MTGMAIVSRRRVRGSAYRAGLGESTRQNAGAFAFSIMITSAFGAVSTLQPAERPWEMFLFGGGGVAGFALVTAVGHLVADPEEQPERVRVVLFAALLAVFSVLGGIGGAALVAWLVGGWEAWLLAPLAGSAAFILLNGLEYALAEIEEEEP
jgi:hypothetical protein